jgi:hypothetical protein
MGWDRDPKAIMICCEASAPTASPNALKSAMRHAAAWALAAGAFFTLVPNPAWADPLPSPSRASVDFAIVIPAVFRIVENTHPAGLVFGDLPSSVAGALPASLSISQRLVLVSTLGRGACVDLALALQSVRGWSLKLAHTPSGTRLSAQGAGYRLCLSRPGRFELALQHLFDLPAPSAQGLPPAPLHWPVMLSVATP